MTIVSAERREHRHHRHHRDHRAPRAPRAPLTAQQNQVATLAASGFTNRDIGERLAVSHRTVGAHLRAVFAKLDVGTRAALPAALGQPFGQLAAPSPNDLRLRALLTPTEINIALFAARGLTNKQIGQRLYLSHRTIGAHLYRMYRKLGVSSRTSLGHALAALAAHDDPGNSSVHGVSP